jgi:hypothetical protein
MPQRTTASDMVAPARGGAGDEEAYLRSIAVLPAAGAVAPLVRGVLHLGAVAPVPAQQLVASATTLVATALDTLAALGLSRALLPGQSLLMALIVSPMVVPLVIVAVGAYFAYAPFGLTGSLVGLTLAHTALAAPFVVITVSSMLQGFDHNQARAGASLGARTSGDSWG